MKIGIFESSTGSGPHVAQITRGLLALGHLVEQYEHGHGYDLVLVHQQVAHRTDYNYPKFPDSSVPFAFIDFAEFGPFTRLPDRAEAFKHGLTDAANAHDTKNAGEQERLRRWLGGKSYPYLLREMHKCIDYPPAFHPIDYPLYHLSDETAIPNRESYLKRSLDLFCWWGHSHPWRLCLEEYLRVACVRSEIGNRWSDMNMPQALYFGRMSSAKTTVSYDGYGSGSFRMTEALCRTCLLQGPLWIRTRASILDGVTCRTYDVTNDGEEFTGTDIASVLRCAIVDAEESFEIYQRGFEHVHEHLTERATAAYLLDVVMAHDYSKPTPLEF